MRGAERRRRPSRGSLFNRAAVGHAELVRQQLLRIGDRAKSSRDGADTRAIRRRVLGEETMNAVLASAGLASGEIATLAKLANTDARFEFLRWMPHAASVGGAAGDAAEMTLFGTCSGEARALSALVQLFTLVLDGLIDEASELFPADERTSLFEFFQQGLDPTVPTPVSVESDHRHPVVTILYQIAGEWIRRTRATRGWSDPVIARETRAAVTAALLAEYGSDFYSLEDTIPPEDLKRWREVLRTKSVNAVWVTCLVPICVHGWPPNLDLDACRKLASSMGTFVGWIDDIDDALIDLMEGRWSEVLLDMYLYAGSQPAARGEKLVDILLEALADDQIRRKLVNTGLRHHDHLSISFDDAVSDSKPIMELIEDVTLAEVGEAGSSQTSDRF